MQSTTSLLNTKLLANAKDMAVLLKAAYDARNSSAPTVPPVVSEYRAQLDKQVKLLTILQVQLTLRAARFATVDTLSNGRNLCSMDCSRYWSQWVSGWG
jgi:hypothetical protein